MAGDAHENNWKDMLRQRFPQYFTGVRVLDVGSADINGTNYPWFTNCRYIGLDVLPYKNVDVVSIAHEYKSLPESFDVVCSTSELEHDKYWELTLKKMVELLKPQGLLWFACASPNRGEHGTLTHNPLDSLTTQLYDEWKTYYRGLSEVDVRNVLNIPAIFSQYGFGDNDDNTTLYFWGIKN